jgi:AcrR family transcriptional regulator
VVQRAETTERARLVDVASAQFVEHGYGTAGLTAMAEAAGLELPHARRLFRSKSELLDAIIAPLIEEIERGLPGFRVGAGGDRIALLRNYLFALLRARRAARIVLFDPSARGTDAWERHAESMRRLVALLVGPRANLERQVRVRCALAVCQLGAGELAGVPAHRLRQPLLEAAIDTMVGSDPRSGRVSSRGEVALDLRPRIDLR